MNMRSLFGLLLPFLLATAACSSSSSGGLAAQGRATDSCGPADGPMLAVVIGSTTGCGDAPGDEPQVHFGINGATRANLAEGQSWSVGGSTSQGVSGTWYPAGATGAPESLTTGTIEVVSVSGNEAAFSYSFEASGKTYSGEVTLALCPLEHICG